MSRIKIGDMMRMRSSEEARGGGALNRKAGLKGAHITLLRIRNLAVLL
jgi:hypothetical protein